MQVLARRTERSERARRATARVALLVFVSVSACLLTPPAEVAVAFDHALHVGGEQKLACEFCHPSTATKDHAGMPAPEICAPCHADIDKNKPRERALRSFFDASSHYLRTPVANLGGDLRFSHKAHVHGGKLDCATCHGDIGSSHGIPRPALSKRDCMACHAERGASNECATCHGQVDRQWQPETHDAAWVARHGDTVRSQAAGSENRCELCHDAQASCAACHRETPPANHTQFFRLRGHGALASVDRSRCSTCHHRRDFCQSCHEATAPLSHGPGFGGTQNRHCVGCHFPATGSGCTTCHPGNLAHPTATPMPVTHDPAMNCRQCHGRGVVLPHPDPGTLCTTCHH